jgi:hypothetical protein
LTIKNGISYFPLGAITRRTFPERTMRYEDVCDLMESARPAILEKARAMGRA